LSNKIIGFEFQFQIKALNTRLLIYRWKSIQCRPVFYVQNMATLTPVTGYWKKRSILRFSFRRGNLDKEEFLS